MGQPAGQWPISQRQGTVFGIARAHERQNRAQFNQRAWLAQHLPQPLFCWPTGVIFSGAIRGDLTMQIEVLQITRDYLG